MLPDTGGYIAFENSSRRARNNEVIRYKLLQAKTGVIFLLIIILHNKRRFAPGRRVYKRLVIRENIRKLNRLEQAREKLPRCKYLGFKENNYNYQQDH